MIGHLRGRALSLRPERVVLDVQGVGYAVQIPLSTYYELESRGGEEVSLHVHTHVREAAIDLYGFSSERERSLFERLIGVSGIGPRLACAILSGLPPDELVAAITAGDALRLARTPGIGRKTAERLVLELSDRLQDLAAELPEAAAPAAPDDVVEALTALGYRPAEAERAAAAAREELGAEAAGAPLSELLRGALKRLSRA